MKSQLPSPNLRLNHETIDRRPGALRLCLTAVALFSLISSAYALNHRPTISSLPNQSTSTSGSFFNPTFVASDDLTTLGTSNIVATADNTSWYTSTITVTDNMNGTFTLGLTKPAGAGMTTVTVKVTDASGLPTSTSFTLVEYSGMNAPPNLGGIPDLTNKKGISPAPIKFISTSNASPAPTATPPYKLTAHSSDQTIIADGGITFPTNDRSIHTMALAPANKSGTATVVVTLGTNAVTSVPLNITSFILDQRPGDAPTLAVNGTNMIVPPPPAATPTPMPFIVTAHTVALADLRYSAISSNPAVVANSASSFTIVAPTSTSDGSIQINPVSGATGAATITLEATDGSYIQRGQFLYVVQDTNLPTRQFAHSIGIFVIDGPDSQNLHHSTILNKDIDLRDANVDDLDLPYVDGYVLRVPWTSLELDQAPANQDDPGTYDFYMITNFLDQNYLGPNQTLSIIFSDEPSYVNANASDTWQDNTGKTTVTRAAPWDTYLRARWNQLMIALGAEPTSGSDTIGTDARIAIINPALPGGTNGIRDPAGSTLGALNGYMGAPFSRANLLAAIQGSLESIQDNLPAKLVQIGFWDIDDEPGATSDLSDYIRDALLTEFDGVNRPRVGFWEENESALRLTAGLDYIAFDPTTGNNVAPFMSGPDTGFADPLFTSKNDTWIGFQMLGSWAVPFNDNHIVKDINGSPNDGLAGGYKTYNSEYAEIYDADLNDDRYSANLQSWHDYLATLTPVDPPLALDLTVSSSTENILDWSPVHGATQYVVQRKALPSGTWADLTPVTAPTTTYTDSGLSAGASYAYRVRAKNGSTDSTYVGAVLIARSILGDDGYVSSGMTFNTLSGGLRAGLGNSGTPIKAILSFDTSEIGTGTVVGGRLRVEQSTGNGAFSSFGAVSADIKNGTFNAEALEAADFGVAADGTLADTFAGVGNGNWEEVSLAETELGNIATGDLTQFRLHFGNPSGSTSNYAGWYSGDSTGNEPILIVNYKTP